MEQRIDSCRFAQRISSCQNRLVQAIVRLHRKRGRDRSGKFLIEGWRPLQQASAAGIRFTHLLASPALRQQEEELLLRWQGQALCIATSAAVFRKICYRQHPDGLLGVAMQPVWKLADLARRGAPLYLVAAAIEKPGNLGAMLRLCDAVGAAGMIVCDPATDLYNPNVVCASIGTLFSVAVATASSTAAIDWLVQQRVQIVAATPSNGQPYSAVDLTLPTAIVIGSEDRGLDACWQQAAQQQVQIPMRGQADSLNAAAAATLLLYEALRQRGQLGEERR